MDRNAFIAFALSFLVLSAWMTWEAKNRPPKPPVVAEQASPETAPAAGETAAKSAPAAPAAGETGAQATPTPPEIERLEGLLYV